MSKSRRWFFIIREPEHEDRYYAERLGSWLLEQDPIRGTLRCFIMQREVGQEEGHEHIQVWVVLKNAYRAAWCLRHLAFPGELPSFRRCDGNIKAQVEYVTKTGPDGLMPGHENFQGM